MSVFPSENEKILTVGLFAFIIGLSIGFLVASNITDASFYLTSFATLVGAFMGSWFAFKLHDKARIRKEIEENTSKANDLLFALFQKLNALKLFQIDSIEPYRDNQAKMFAILPTLDFKFPEAKIKPENINFLFKTRHKDLLFDLHIEEQRFKEAEKLVRFRSDLHFNYVQPALEASGVIAGKDYTDAQFRDILGDRLWIQLEKSTNDLIYHVDRTVKSGDRIRERLIKALKEVYPAQDFLNFVLRESRERKMTESAV